MIPELVVNKDLQTVQEIALSLDQDWKEILRDCVPKILVHILPLFAASRLSETGEDEIVKRRTSKATACYDMLISEISNEVCIVQVLVYILPLFAASRLSEIGEDENVKRRTLLSRSSS